MESTEETALKELNALLLAEETIKSTLDRVSQLVCETLDGCDAVGVTLITGSTPSTATATDGFALKIDEQQYETDEGPCLEAYRTGETIQIHDVGTEDRWPRFIEGAAKASLRSSLSLPLAVGNKRIGALNIYSKSEDAFDDDSRKLGQRFSEQASVALSNAQVYASAVRLAAHLQEALKSREVIGQAKGILMAQRGLSDGDAFQLLVKQSQTSNVKLRDISQQVVDQTKVDASRNKVDGL